jgi:hypothetical protein
MTQTFLICVEIKTIEASLNNPAPDSTLTIFCDPQNNCFVGSDLDQVKTAILGAIPHLGTNFRYPLFFNLQIKSGDRTDALINSIKHQQALLPRRRLRQTRNN